MLAAAERLFARGDPAMVTMDAVAAEAGVGKGTLFRRFGDRAGLARAVLSEHETELQDAMIRGAAAARPRRAAARAPDRVRRAPTSSSSSATATLLREAEGSHDAFLRSARLRLLPHARGAAAARGRLGERADFLADVVMAPLAATAFTVPPRAARRSRCEQLADAHADLVHAAPRLIAMSAPVVPASVDEVADGLQGVGYLPGESTALVAYLAARLGKPVLVEGPAGVGKTELAKALAEYLQRDARAPAVLRGPRRGQGAVRVELPQAAAADPGRGRRHRLAGRPGRHLRRGVPARAPAAAGDRHRPSPSSC